MSDPPCHIAMDTQELVSPVVVRLQGHWLEVSWPMVWSNTLDTSQDPTVLEMFLLQWIPNVTIQHLSVTRRGRARLLTRMDLIRLSSIRGEI